MSDLGPVAMHDDDAAPGLRDRDGLRRGPQRALTLGGNLASAVWREGIAPDGEHDA